MSPKIKLVMMPASWKGTFAFSFLVCCSNFLVDLLSRTEGDPRLVVADKIAQEARFASVDLLGTSTAKEDDEDDKLAQPLREVKQDIVEKAKQIKQENAWIEQVLKVSRVRGACLHVFFSNRWQLSSRVTKKKSVT